MNIKSIEKQLETIEKEIVKHTRELKDALANVPDGETDYKKYITDDEMIKVITINKKLEELGKEHNKLMIEWDLSVE